MDHLTMDLYMRALRGEVPITALVRLAHAHLLDDCAVCCQEWQDGDGGGYPLPLPRPDQTAAGSDLADIPDAWLLTQDQFDRDNRRRSRRLEARRLAREDLKRLLGQPAETWYSRVAGARTRYRSRSFAEALIAECRQRVRSRPDEAAALAALVPVALSWTRYRSLPWAPRLLLRAAAHHANALRVAGDLAAAEAGFRAVRYEMDLHPLPDAALAAEVDSLEAALAIGLGAFEDADRLLRSAGRIYRQLGERDGEARANIQLANLMQSFGRADAVLQHLHRASQLLDETRQPYLHACTVTGRVNALCDLGRAEAAARVLEEHATVYTSSEDPFVCSMGGFLEGRVALDLGREARAEECFRAARDQFLEQGRTYDAILGSLYLADALLAGGKMEELRSLAADLVPLFRSRGVARETLASLRLLAQAVTAETINTALLQRVRKTIEGGPITGTHETRC